MSETEKKIAAYVWNNRVVLRKSLTARGIDGAVVELDRIVARVRADRKLREQIEIKTEDA